VEYRNANRGANVVNLIERNRLFVLSAALLCLNFSFSSVAQAENYADGMSAYEAGDFKTAREIFLPMAEEGEHEAQYALGVMYQDGDGLAKDEIQAARWYREAAIQDHHWAQHAVAWLTKAAHAGVAAAQHNLAQAYETGLGAKQDYTKARDWYTKAAKQKYVSSYIKLGAMHERGLGEEAKPEQAVYWFEQAAMQGDSFGEFNLGIMYLLGSGVKQDNDKAIEWLQKAADQGVELRPPGSISLAVCYGSRIFTG